MAPTKQNRQSKHRKLISISKKVQSGRVGRAEPARSYVNRNKGKELILPTSNAQKELFPNPRNTTKELLPQLLPTVDRSSLNTHKRDRTLTPIANHPRRPKSRAMVAVQAANLQQRRAKRIQDGITTRLQAMKLDPEYAITDARFTSTIPYKSARLDLQVNAPIPGRRKLEFAIAVGFWGFSPTFTPVKIFSLSSERFADPRGLASLILANADVQYPKGHRYTDYTESDTFGRPRDRNTSFEVVQSGERVLVNTECAMKEFFWQAEHYASDENGRVLIQVTGRIGKTNDNGYENFDANWRNDDEKELAVEEKRRYLERQSFVKGTERKTLYEKMRAIEERSRVAVQNAQARKQQMGELLAIQKRDTDNAIQNLHRPAQNIKATNNEDDFDEIDLDLDIDMELDLNMDLFSLTEHVCQGSPQSNVGRGKGRIEQNRAL